jgi:membrane fusion protein, copper/silver efflux system
MMKLPAGGLPGLSFAQVQQVKLPGLIQTTGQVSFDDRKVATITSRVQGRIENVRVSLWDSVQRGEPIVELYSPDFMTGEAEYLQAKTTSRLSASPSIEGSSDLAQSMVTAAKRKLELLGMEDVEIERLRGTSPILWMRAPISGTVLQNQAMRGAMVNPGDVLYQLGTLDHVWITADIYEVDLARVHVGESLQALVTSFPDAIFNGVISRISPDIDADTHTLQIRCDVNNPDHRLKPQMLARIRIITQTSTADVVSLDALAYEDNKYFAFVDEGDAHLERREVTIGEWNEEGYARVISGLKAGDRVVITGTLQVNGLWHEAHGQNS